MKAALVYLERRDLARQFATARRLLTLSLRSHAEGSHRVRHLRRLIAWTKAQRRARVQYANKPAHRVEILEGPNSNGGYHFALFWMAWYHPGRSGGEYGWGERAQHFRAKLPQGVPRVDLRR